MNKRYLILIATSIVGLVGGLTWFMIGPREPRFESKRLVVWLAGYDGQFGTPQWKKADEAVRYLGSNAIPILWRLLQKEDSELKLRLIGLAQKQHFIKVNHVPA